MGDSNTDFQSAHEIGKVYHSLLEKRLLCDFFMESAPVFLGAAKSFLFLSENGESLWVEAQSPETAEAPADIKEKAGVHFRKGQPVLEGHAVYVPLVAQNQALGLACFIRDPSENPFTQRDLEIAADLAAQMAGAFKNVLLMEQNIKMARLSAIGETMSMVLHEIKNIIQLAIFSVSFVEESAKKDPPDRNYLERGLTGMQKAVRHMNGFIYETLSLSQDYKISPSAVNLREVVRELRDDLQAKAEQRHVRLDFQIEENVSEVEGEHLPLYRALLNLIKNAIEACDKKKDAFVQVRIRSLDQEFYQVTVEDNGSGMSEEVRARLFQSFFTTKGKKGTGLGLMILDRTVKAHQGKISIESEPGKGTQFSLTLPRKISSLSPA